MRPSIFVIAFFFACHRRRTWSIQENFACRRWTALLLIAVSLLLAHGRAWGQANSATFHGTVTDPTGAVVAGAAVTLTNENTGAALHTLTGGDGEFVFTFIPVRV